jgi:hypothetical protein
MTLARSWAGRVAGLAGLELILPRLLLLPWQRVGRISAAKFAHTISVVKPSSGMDIRRKLTQIRASGELCSHRRRAWPSRKASRRSTQTRFCVIASARSTNSYARPYGGLLTMLSHGSSAEKKSIPVAP